MSKIGSVARFDYGYQVAGRRRPDRLPTLLAAHRQALEDLVPQESPIVLIGKSMGSRIGCHLAVKYPERIHAIVCLGYPLVSASGKLRDEVLLALTTPILFVQGTRDRLAPLETLEEARGRMSTFSRVHVVDEGDHSLQITKRRMKRDSISQEDVDTELLTVISDFVANTPPA